MGAKKSKKMKTLMNQLGVQLSRPTQLTHEKINKKFDETAKKEAWIPDETARPKIGTAEKNFGILKKGKRSMAQALLDERTREKKDKAGHRRSQ